MTLAGHIPSPQQNATVPPSSGQQVLSTHTTPGGSMQRDVVDAQNRARHDAEQHSWLFMQGSLSAAHATLPPPAPPPVAIGRHVGELPPLHM